MTKESTYYKDVGCRIRRLRENLKMSQLDIANKIGVTGATVSRYESGKLKLDILTTAKLAIALNCSPIYILKGEAPSTIGAKNIVALEPKMIPLIGTIAAGKPIMAEENFEGLIPRDDKMKADFGLRVKGDSMVGAHIVDGSVVYIQQTDTVDNGTIAAVWIEDEATLKRFYYYPDKNMVILKAENPKYQDMIFVDDELDRIKVIGKAVGYISYIK